MNVLPLIQPRCDHLGHGLPRLDDESLMLPQLSQGFPVVIAIRFGRNSDAPEHSRLENTAKAFGHAGHLLALRSGWSRETAPCIES